jgi:hypothetical protein
MPAQSTRQQVSETPTASPSKAFPHRKLLGYEHPNIRVDKFRGFWPEILARVAVSHYPRKILISDGTP